MRAGVGVRELLKLASRCAPIHHLNAEGVDMSEQSSEHIYAELHSRKFIKIRSLFFPFLSTCSAFIHDLDVCSSSTFSDERKMVKPQA